jgi:signal peptidase I
MESPSPPPLPKPKRVGLSRSKVLIGLSLVGGFLTVTLFGLLAFGLVKSLSCGSSSMSPTVSRGDHVLMEGFTHRVRPPRRGDIALFTPDGIESTHLKDKFYIKRIAGEPGERLLIVDGQLQINGTNVVLSNRVGAISYPLPAGGGWPLHQNEITIPAGHYYVLGDNSTNSYDSRFYGFVPASNILGRITYCHWPPLRVGPVR